VSFEAAKLLVSESSPITIAICHKKIKRGKKGKKVRTQVVHKLEKN
jgi:hypothetical protein